jgi:glyoxylase-like metal-dependent hydrolase (beta-lactamase superfamily II)
LLIERGMPSLENMRKQNQAYRQVKIILPQLTFGQGTMALRVGKKNLTISSATGHSHDGISVLVDEDRILFAGDAFMPIPYLVDGNADDIAASIRRIGRMGLENIIQGHGDIILRGEIEAAIRENLNYIANIRKVVKTAKRRKYPQEYLDQMNIESCGKSRVHLGGLAEELHHRNLRGLLQQTLEEEGKEKADKQK